MTECPTCAGPARRYGTETVTIHGRGCQDRPASGVVVVCQGYAGAETPAGLVGSFLADFDPDAHAGHGQIDWTADQAKAVVFAGIAEAHACWTAVPDSHPVRESDGMPNRPLTAFAIGLQLVVGPPPAKPYCPDCSAPAGEAHDTPCTIARCLVTGASRAACGGLDHDGDCGDDAWTGHLPGEAEAAGYGFWVLLDAFTPRRRVPAGTPGAVPDVTRLAAECAWDRDTRRWVRP
jgi:hypothetical protein